VAVLAQFEAGLLNLDEYRVGGALRRIGDENAPERAPHKSKDHLGLAIPEVPVGGSQGLTGADRQSVIPG
jgi:hypothetical protein